jgi:2,3-bisphosphoglycerate-dependent phosphoglycerate mutase
MGKLILLRHGQSTWNLENRFTGWIDVPLTPAGEEEARRAGELIKDIPLDISFTSVLTRAIETNRLALEAAGQPNVPVVKDKAVNERMYGDLQGLNKAETAKQYGDQLVLIWRRSYDVAPPNGESLKDTSARTLPYFYDRILPEVKSGKNVLVSAHGNSLRAIVMKLDNLDEKQVLELNIPNGVPIVYEIDEKGDVISRSELK